MGAATEVEMIEKKHRIDDALEAVRSAQEEGIVAGGGTALINAVRNIELETDNEEQKAGVAIIVEAIEEPLRQMSINAGLSPDIIVSTVKGLEDPSFGINFMTGEVVDLIKTGIIDPVKVTRCALENAVSVASTIITTSHAVIQQ